jgi:TolB protein
MQIKMPCVPQYQPSHLSLRKWRLYPLLLLAFLLVSCANPQWIIQSEEDGTANPADVQVNDPSNRLLVQGIDGNLYTMRPDGSERVLLTNDASSRHQYIQPTWSPSGNRIAWSEIDGRGGELKSALVVSHSDGMEREHFETPYAPFYLQWSPDEARLAYLSNWMNLNSATIALRVVDFAATEEKIRTLVDGQPLYFAWAPTSDRLLTHISNERLEFRDLTGEGIALASTFASFPAPQWSTDGSQLLYALGEAGKQQLVLTDLEGNLIQEITDYSESISFSLNSTNDHVAYAITSVGLGTAAFGPLYVVELDSLRTRELSSEPVMAFFWSPDGEKLAYLATEESDGITRLRWYVWDGTEKRAYDTLVPSRTFLQAHLAFFDQYARGMTLWSPDSSAFAYAAVDSDTGNNIWVQQLNSDTPQQVGRGTFVAWSPR